MRRGDFFPTATLKSNEQIQSSCKQRCLAAYDFQLAVRIGERVHGNERQTRLLDGRLNLVGDNVGAVGGNRNRQPR